ncbi:Transcription factor fungi [Macrophomina phaseolina MS6]|uniref:Transcription factor fungi n=1 Tax=Macrophomina phaseolina (strain MS6) TaxID=1126212 RepID=K2R509_MACPH|nr:Transcription factor fungi [Macrophomina phaseolina MS6]
METSREKDQATTPSSVRLTASEPDALRKRSRSVGSKDETSKKRRLEAAFSPLESIRPMSTPQSPSTVEAQSYIQQELEAAKDLSSTRRTVLRSIGELINQLHGRVKVNIGARPGFNCSGTILQDIDYPPIEFLYWMLREIRSNSLGFHVSYFFKHVSTISLEKMGIALVHQQEDQETLLLYSICVNSLAAKFLNTIISEESDAEMSHEIRTAMAKYTASAELAMSRIPLLASPSLTLLQALLCSAFICQGQGDTAACWSFTSAACKTCMDLGLHTGRGNFYDPQTEDNELYYCFVWCYMLDKSFSMNLSRRTCLLDTDLINPTESIWVHAPVNLLTIYLELARIQSVVVSDLNHRAPTEDSTDQYQKSALTGKLIQQMQDFQKELDGMRKLPERFRGLYMESELQALEFSYWSVMTAIRRCERASRDSKTSVGENCLEAARSAILSLRLLQRSQPLSNGGTKMSFVNW